MTTDITPIPRYTPPARAGLAVLTLIGGFLISQLVAFLVAAVLVTGDELPGWAPPVLVAVADLIALVVVLAVAGRVFAQQRPVHFGFRRATFWPTFGLVLAALVAVFIVTLSWNTAINNTDIQDAADTLVRSGMAQRIVAVAVIAVPVPIMEEVLFRGFLFTAMRQWVGPWAGAGISGVLFALAHLGSSEPSALLPLAVLGFLACVLYWVTGSLLAPIALHCMQNGLAVTGNVGLPLLAAPLLMVGAALVALAVVAPFSGAPSLPLRLTDAQEQPQHQPGDHGRGQ